MGGDLNRHIDPHRGNLSPGRHKRRPSAKIQPMNATNTTELMHTLGQQAKVASALMAQASAATKQRALLGLAGKSVV